MAEYAHANPRYAALATRLIQADPANLGHIDVGAISFLEKEEKKPKKPVDIQSIKEPLTMLCNKLYYITISEQLCNDMSQEQFELAMYRTLRHIDPEGGIIVPNVKEYSDIIETFGWDWPENPNIPSIFDILNGDVDSRAQATP